MVPVSVTDPPGQTEGVKTLFPLRFIYEKGSCTLNTDNSDILSLKPKCIIPKIITNEKFESITYSEL